MAPPSDEHFLPALIYDEFDLSAMALRGWNAEHGRRAGAPQNPDNVNSAYFSRYLSWNLPLRDRYFLEYPHAALLFFRAGFWIQPGWRDARIPNGVLDCDYHNIADFHPKTESDFEWIQPIVLAAHFYVVVMFVAFMALILVLEWGYGPETGTSRGALLLLLPATLFFAFNRFDLLPALLTALGFACLGRRRIEPAAIFFGLATLIKVYPILFVPIIARYLWPNRRDSMRFVAVYAATGLLAFAPLLAGDDWQAVFGPYQFQLTRPPEHGMVLYGVCLPLKLLDGSLGTAFRLGSLSLAIALATIFSIPDLASLLRRCALVLFVFVSLAVFYSPQWIVWFAPLLIPLVGRSPRLAWGIVALDVITYLTFPVWFWIVPGYVYDWSASFEPLIVARNLGTSRHYSIAVVNHLGNFLRLRAASAAWRSP